jgi:hypothetical protein
VALLRSHRVPELGAASIAELQDESTDGDVHSRMPT